MGDTSAYRDTFNSIYMKRTLIIPPVTPQDKKYLKVQFMRIDKQLNLLNARYNILQTENERLNILVEKQVYSNNIDSLTAKSNIEVPTPPDYGNRLLIIASLLGLLCVVSLYTFAEVIKINRKEDKILHKHWTKNITDIILFKK